MFVFLTILAILCGVVASSGYEAPPNSNIGNQDGLVYEQGYYHRPYYYHNDKKCRKLKHFDLEVQMGWIREAELSTVKRDGKRYMKISCPDDTYQYALVTKKSGSKINGPLGEVNDVAILAIGHNIDYIAQCDGKRTTGTDVKGETINIENVSCYALYSWQFII